MIKGFNLQHLISYLGLLPIIIIILVKIFLIEYDNYIFHNFIIYYSIIIFVFIGAINWNLKKNISISLILYGFSPSFFAIPIIFLNLYSYDVVKLLIFSFIVQLFFDYYIVYKKKSDKKIYYFVRLPLTLFVVISLSII